MTAPADPLSPAALAEFDAFAVALNRASAGVILPLFRATHGLEDKGGARGFDPVTEADRGAEAVIREMISARYPDHGVVGEEYGSDRPDAEFVWVIDPIDGTRAFISGLPTWTTLIGLRRGGVPVLGSIGQPFIGEIFIGHAGGARLIAAGEERALRTRSCARLGDALAATTDPYLFTGPEHDAWTRFRRSVRLVRYSCDAYAYAMVAAGQLDLVVETGLKDWDVEAARALLSGAGGVVADWSGAPMSGGGGRMLIAGDPRLLEAASAALVPLS